MADVAIEREGLEAPRESALTRFYRDHISAIRAAISFLVVGIVWEITARQGNSLVIAPLSEIWASFVKLLLTGQLWRHFLASFQAFVWGFTLASIAGIVVGIAIATSEAVRDFVDPWISALYATPTIALAPLFILIFGIDIPSKVAVVFLLVLFPVIINTATGIRTTEKVFIEAAHSFGATRMQIFTKVLIPSSLPFIVAGLRLGIGRGLVGVVVGELFGARAGLGFLILISSQVFDTASLFVGVFILAGLGILSVVVLQKVERRMAPWREFELK
ncbi:MAG: ABC transporter permease [Chloroflexi bacterium]|nr:ABC transporter permease [Chloroflexota bacterium]